MSLATTIAVVSISAAFAVLESRRALRAGVKGKQIALWGLVALTIGGGLSIYLLLFTSLLGDIPGKFLASDLLGSRAERSMLFLYAAASGGLAALLTGGLAHITSASGKA